MRSVPVIVDPVASITCPSCVPCRILTDMENQIYREGFEVGMFFGAALVAVLLAILC